MYRENFENFRAQQKNSPTLSVPLLLAYQKLMRQSDKKSVKIQRVEDIPRKLA